MQLIREGASRDWAVDGAAFVGHHKLANILRERQSTDSLVISLAQYEGLFTKKLGLMQFLCELPMEAVRKRYALLLKQAGLFHGDVASIVSVSRLFRPIHHESTLTDKMLIDFSALNETARAWLLHDFFDWLSNEILPQHVIMHIASMLLPNLNEDEITVLQRVLRETLLGKNLVVKRLTAFLSLASADEKDIIRSLLSEIKQVTTVDNVFKAITEKLTAVEQSKIDSTSFKKSIVGFFKPVGSLVTLLHEEQERLQRRFRLTVDLDQPDDFNKADWLLIEDESNDTCNSPAPL